MRVREEAYIGDTALIVKESDNLPLPDVLAADKPSGQTIWANKDCPKCNGTGMGQYQIVEQLEAALEEFRSVENILTTNGDT